MKVYFPLCLLMGLIFSLLSVNRVDGFLTGFSCSFILGSFQLFLRSAFWDSLHQDLIREQEKTKP